MRTNSQSEAQDGRVAFLWDESFLWGVMAYRALRAAGLSFVLVRAEDVRNGALAGCRAVFVPGGWASNKAKALGDEGMRAIRRFVEQGGGYIGFCGGAGLATRDGIGLVPVTRRATKDRVPSFSGRIWLNTQDHDLWTGIREPIFHAWWPSQFLVDKSVTVLATYGEALPDAFTSDVNVGDGTAAGSWADLESVYQINLDPKRLLGDPAVLEGTCGRGRVLLSLVHFDTPQDGNGIAVLRNIWRTFGCKHRVPDALGVPWPPQTGDSAQGTSGSMAEIQETTDRLISLGQRNFLWFRRTPLLLQWRRGVRGLEYCTLSVMVQELAELLKRDDGPRGLSGLDASLTRIRDLLRSFAAQSQVLLVRERFALQHAHLTYERCGDPEIQAIREELFSRSKSHGGFFKGLVDEIDGLLYRALKRSECRGGC